MIKKEEKGRVKMRKGGGDERRREKRKKKEKIGRKKF